MCIPFDEGRNLLPYFEGSNSTRVDLEDRTWSDQAGMSSYSKASAPVGHHDPQAVVVAAVAAAASAEAVVVVVVAMVVVRMVEHKPERGQLVADMGVDTQFPAKTALGGW